MSLHRHCDRCEKHTTVLPNHGTLGATVVPQLVRGKRQGMFGPVPNVLDLCVNCQASLLEWLAGA